jgi:N-acetylmuramoyl-L-alanine amidase
MKKPLVAPPDSSKKSRKSKSTIAQRSTGVVAIPQGSFSIVVIDAGHGGHDGGIGRQNGSERIMSSSV